MQAVASKGQTPASNSPDDIAEAISNISNMDQIYTQTKTYSISQSYTWNNGSLTFSFPHKLIGVSSVSSSVLDNTNNWFDYELVSLNISGNSVNFRAALRTSNSATSTLHGNCTVKITAIGY